jgi:hypothetical protein
MSIKSLQKQMMAAVAMVLVAAIALSSATYAWFVNNATVTATDVSVQAATAYSLLISPKNGTDATWGTTAAFAKELTTLTPVSTVGEIATKEIKLTKAEGETKAIGIGDGTSVAVGDVRFVTNTDWKDNYVTAVSEVSKKSTVGTADEGTSNTYFYQDTVYLKAAQAGNIYLDSTGIGIVWAKYDASKDSKFADEELISLTEFAKLTEISTTDLGKETKPTLAAAEEYNEKLTSAQALLKTMRVGLLVTQGSGDNITRTWHEYELCASNLTNTANTTLGKDSGADGIANAVSALDKNSATATSSSPVVAAIAGANKMASGKTIVDYAIKGEQSSVATVKSDDTMADVIAETTANEEVQVDVYVWMEGCDVDTIAANITSFSGTGVSGLQLGFCLGKVETAQTVQESK